MKRLLALCLIALSAAGQVFAQAPQPPEIAARAYLLVDLSSQQVLAEREADAQFDPASLTKLMTAYLVFSAIQDKKLSLEQRLPVSARAWAERKGGGSLMFIDTTMTPTVEELLKGTIVQSGNDSSVALAEAVGGSLDSFVAMMNKQAQAWGMKNTQFKNVTGLSEPGHYASARDVALMASKIINDFPDFYTYYSIRQYTYNRIKQDNRNLLLGRDPTVDGMKTGYTDAAGYCLVASAVRDMPNGKRRLLSVVLGTASREARASESQKLLNWGFQAWDAVRLFEADKPMLTLDHYVRDARIDRRRGRVIEIDRRCVHCRAG
jgi:D-alanyl-D-alanine carboxypeptidase (penicillin-binding protein 5/6)